MAFKLKGAVDIKATPEPDAPLLITMFGQTLFGTGQTATDSTGAGWTNVLIPPGLVDGWVRDTEVTSAPDPGPLPLDLEAFVRQCMLVDRSLNAEPTVAPNFITADFLIARAIIETGLTQAKFTGAILNGPFRLAQAEWDAFLASDLQVKASFSPASAIYPMAQVFAAGFSMHADGKAFSAASAAGGAPDDDPVIPSYLDLFHSVLTDPATALALKQHETDATKTLADAGVTRTVAAAIARRPRLAQVEAAMAVPAFFALTEPLLSEALDAAFAKIRTLAPDELPPDPPAGAAPTTPWFDVAAKEADAKVSEASNPDRIRSYFAATDFGRVGAGPIPAWCGAFAAFCMNQVGVEVPKGAARAANWKAWGQRTVPAGSHDIPVGAVVVMTPSPGTGSSGHVAFFAEASSDGQKLTLLGGNQSDAVNRSAGFRVTRVAMIRVRGSEAAVAGAANSFDLTAAGVAREFQPMGDRIVDRFRRAGLGKHQHLLAALANAIAESGLDHNAVAKGGEQSFGLFQCNRTHGLGIGFTVEQLKDPDTNIGIIVKAARAVSTFVAASSMEAAVDAFVQFIERPKDRDGAVRARLAIANKLL